MADGSLAQYNGSAGFLVDRNIWIDCIDAASPWHDWAVDQVQACGERAPLHINLIIYTELLVPEPDIAALDAMLHVYETQRSNLPWACAALVAKAFGLYRKRGGLRHAPLPDFYIAHAAVANLVVDAGRNLVPQLLSASPASVSGEIDGVRHPDETGCITT